MARFPCFSLICMYFDKHKPHYEIVSGVSVNYLGKGIKFHGRHIGRACLLLTVFIRLFICLKVKINLA